MRRYRPTTLRIFSEGCPAALDFFIKKETGAAHGDDRMDSYSRAEREIEGNEAAEIGIAFHACVHAAAEYSKKKLNIRAAIEATALAITNQMDPARARAGADMALIFIENWKFDERLNYEHGLAFTKDWKHTGWDEKDGRLRAILDVYGVYDEENDDGKFKVAISEDYKTGWGATANILDSIQMKVHSSMLLTLHGKDVDFIEVRVQATRFRKIFSKRWDMRNEGDVADLEKRKTDVEFWMNAADISDLKPRIGPGCINCDFSGQCSAFQERIANLMEGSDLVNVAMDPESAARDYAILQKETKRLHDGLKEATRNRQIVIGEMILGYHINQKRRLKDAANLVDFWFSKSNGSMNSADDAKRNARGLVRAMAPGTTQFDNMVKTIARAIGFKSQKAAIEELSKEFCNNEEEAKFKWAKNKALDQRDEAEE